MASVTASACMSLTRPSLHSRTSGLTVGRLRPISGFCAIARRISATVQAATPNVLVKRIGVSMRPSSASCIRPALLPKPLSTARPAGTGLRNRSPSCGKIAVTPVRAVFSRWVRCPTVTPGTSAMVLAGPAGRSHHVPALSKMRSVMPRPPPSVRSLRGCRLPRHGSWHRSVYPARRCAPQTA